MRAYLVGRDGSPSARRARRGFPLASAEERGPGGEATPPPDNTKPPSSMWTGAKQPARGATTIRPPSSVAGRTSAGSSIAEEAAAR